MATRKRRSKAAGQAGATSEDRVIDAALKLAASQGWHGLSLADIAAEAGLPLAGLYALFPSKGAIVDGFARRIERATLSGVEFDDTTSIRDRLFDLFMRRFDALSPYKQAVKSLVADQPRDPISALCQTGRMLRSMRGMAAAAGVDSSGLLGMLRIKALGVIYLYILRVWLGDDGTDQSKTMAALDTALKRAEMIAQSLPTGRPYRERTS